MTIIAMIPARMGSQRLKRKNLQPLAGIPLIAHAIRKCLAAGVFDEIWVNADHDEFGTIAKSEGAQFHRRPDHLGNNTATSEQFVAEFLELHPCELIFQVHSIAPLLTAAEVRRFVNTMQEAGQDALMSVVEERLECAYNGEPVNFTFSEKTNSQDLMPIQRIVWAITGWRRETYLQAVRSGRCATYSGQIGFYPVGPWAGHVIKTQQDLDLAAALYGVMIKERTID